MVAESRYFNQKLALSPQWPLSCSSWPYIKSSSSSSLAFHRANAGRLSRCLLGDFTACPLCTVPCALTQSTATAQVPTVHSTQCTGHCALPHSSILTVKHRAKCEYFHFLTPMEQQHKKTDVCFFLHQHQPPQIAKYIRCRFVQIAKGLRAHRLEDLK